MAHSPATFLSCQYKHSGFHQEQEVRIVAIRAEDENQSPVDKPVREVRHFLRNGTHVPYIPLFEALPDGCLPITRVIVGPHQRKSQRKAVIESMLATYEIDAHVEVSDIPYVG
jgi:hypothetical protein